jgi:hypothetical protein
MFVMIVAGRTMVANSAAGRLDERLVVEQRHRLVVDRLAIERPVRSEPGRNILAHHLAVTDERGHQRYGECAPIIRQIASRSSDAGDTRIALRSSPRHFASSVDDVNRLMGRERGGRSALGNRTTHARAPSDAVLQRSIQ